MISSPGPASWMSTQLGPERLLAHELGVDRDELGGGEPLAGGLEIFGRSDHAHPGGGIAHPSGLVAGRQKNAAIGGRGRASRTGQATARPLGALEEPHRRAGGDRRDPALPHGAVPARTSVPTGQPVTLRPLYGVQPQRLSIQDP